MKKIILTIMILLFMPVVSIADGSFYISFNDGYHINSVGVGYRNTQHRVRYHHTYVRNNIRYYRNGYSHIHRQAGRIYVNDYNCAPVVVVPSGRYYNTSTYYHY